MTVRIDLTVEHEDGTVDKVTADMRDIVAFERDQRTSWREAQDRTPLATIWTLAYYASRRAGVVDAKTDLDAWQNTVVEVASVAGDVDPTNLEATAEPQ